MRRHDRTNIGFDLVQHGPHDPRFANLVLSGDRHASIQVNRGGNGHQEHDADSKREENLQQRKCTARVPPRDRRRRILNDTHGQVPSVLPRRLILSRLLGRLQRLSLVVRDDGRFAGDERGRIADKSLERKRSVD